MALSSREVNVMAGAKDYQIMPVFYSESVQMDFKSREAGRPIYEDQEFVKMIIPGTRGSVIVERVNDEHRARWGAEYAAFKAGRELPVDGTPLREWPVGAMTASRADELAYFHIRTVEQLAALGDDKLGNIGMGARELRDRAKLWLSVAKNGSAPLERLQSENERLSIENGRLTSALTAANAQVQQLTLLTTKDPDQ